MPTRSEYNPTPPPLSDRARNADLERMLDNKPDEDDVWVFAYGSLIWNPCFVPGAKETVDLAGFRRAFNFWSVISRGTPERPGLGLGLNGGGTCTGVAFRIDTGTMIQDLRALWRREMFHNVYRSEWHTVQTPTRTFAAITFVTNPDHANYAGDLSVQDTVRIIAEARGENGSCRAYLEETVAALAEHGIDDEALSDLLERVSRQTRP